MAETLAKKKCTPCRGGIPPLALEEAERFQSQTPNWELRDDGHRIERTFRCAIFMKRLASFETWVSWLKLKAIIRISASGGDTRPSRYAPRRLRGCTRTILLWRARSIGCSIAPKVTEIETLARCHNTLLGSLSESSKISHFGPLYFTKRWRRNRGRTKPRSNAQVAGVDRGSPHARLARAFML